MTLWVTNGTMTFEVPEGSPEAKRLLSQGYEVCESPVASTPVEPDASGAEQTEQTLGGGDLAASEPAPAPETTEESAPKPKTGSGK